MIGERSPGRSSEWREAACVVVACGILVGACGSHLHGGAGWDGGGHDAGHPDGAPVPPPRLFVGSWSQTGSLVKVRAHATHDAAGLSSIVFTVDPQIEGGLQLKPIELSFDASGQLSDATGRTYLVSCDGDRDQRFSAHYQWSAGRVVRDTEEEVTVAPIGCCGQCGSGNLTRRVYQGEWHYTADGLVEEIVYTSESGLVARRQAFTRDPHGYVVERHLHDDEASSDLHWTYGYDAEGRRFSESVEWSGLPGAHVEGRYRYSGSGGTYGWTLSGWGHATGTGSFTLVDVGQAAFPALDIGGSFPDAAAFSAWQAKYRTLDTLVLPFL
jgi:hypothetical protein